MLTSNYVATWFHCTTMNPLTTRADSRFEPSQWETPLQSNAVSHWLGANLKSAMTTVSCHPDSSYFLTREQILEVCNRNLSPPGQTVCHFADSIFICIFLKEIFWIFYKILLKCFFGSNWQYGSIGSDNGLVPNRCQAIIWSNDGMVQKCMYAPLEPLKLNVLTLNFHLVSQTL